MLSYSNPLCPTTHEPAVMFCYTDNCSHPAFACKPEEIIRHKHSLSGKCNFWEEVFPLARSIIEGELLPTDIATLEKQEKQIKCIIEDLKIILVNHRRNLQLYRRQKPKLKEVAEKVLSSLTKQTSEQITGGDMAHFIRTLESNDFFIYKQVVEKFIKRQNNIIQSLLPKLRTLIEGAKIEEERFSKLAQVQNSDNYIKVVPILDIPNSNKAVVRNDSISIKTGKTEKASVFTSEWCSVFTCKELIENQCFEVQLVDIANKYYAVGVATADLRNKTEQSSAQLCWRGSQKPLTELANGDKITVRRSAIQIEWLHNGEFLTATPIPNELINEELFPVLQFKCYDESKSISKLKII